LRLLFVMGSLPHLLDAYEERADPLASDASVLLARTVEGPGRGNRGLSVPRGLGGVGGNAANIISAVVLCSNQSSKRGAGGRELRPFSPSPTAEREDWKK
jgi:hypothetical protein